jgi:tetratricopeptide (TPR) repeat protein
MAHLWRADCLRQIAVAQKSKGRFAAAGESYRRFLSLTNYSTPVHQWFAYHFIGSHLGERSHPDRKLSYDGLRKAGYLGLCICERNTGNPLRAREYCRRAIRYDPKNAIAHFVLGLAHLGVFATSEACEDIDAARKSFSTMLTLNPQLAESKHARHYIEEIDIRKPALRKKGC